MKEKERKIRKKNLPICLKISIFSPEHMYELNIILIFHLLTSHSQTEEKQDTEVAKRLIFAFGKKGGAHPPATPLAQN